MRSSYFGHKLVDFANRIGLLKWRCLLREGSFELTVCGEAMCSARATAQSDASER